MHPTLKSPMRHVYCNQSHIHINHHFYKWPLSKFRTWDATIEIFVWVPPTCAFTRMQKRTLFPIMRMSMRSREDDINLNEYIINSSKCCLLFWVKTDQHGTLFCFQSSAKTQNAIFQSKISWRACFKSGYSGESTIISTGRKQ